MTSIEKVAGSCPSEALSAETQEKHEVVIQHGSFGIDQKDKNLNDCHLSNCSSQQVINKTPSSSPYVSSMMSNSSIGRSKHHKSFGTKVLGKLKMVLRKQSHNKAKNFPDKTSTRSDTADTKTAVSSCCSKGKDICDTRRGYKCILRQTGKTHHIASLGGVTKLK